MKILAIETSCDETAVAVVEGSGTLADAHFKILGNALYSQADKHAPYGGVYPTLAKREHAENLVPLMDKALTDAGLRTEGARTLNAEMLQYLRTLLVREPRLYNTLVHFVESYRKPGVDLIAVTHGPGLEPALWVGVNFANALAYVWNIPVLAINHLEGHIVSAAAKPVNEAGTEFALGATPFPALALLASGGHTQLVHAESWGTYKVVGETRDDAVGEAYDKVARMLGLPYPGGVSLSKLADEGRRRAHEVSQGSAMWRKPLPRPMIQSDDLNFSFSGLKTAVLYLIRDAGTPDDEAKRILAAEFDAAVGDVITTKVDRALMQHPATLFVMGGGVSASEYLRSRLRTMLTEKHPEVQVRFPSRELSTDNAVMIALNAYVRTLHNDAEGLPGAEAVDTPTDCPKLRANGSLKL